MGGGDDHNNTGNVDNSSGDKNDIVLLAQLGNSVTFKRKKKNNLSNSNNDIHISSATFAYRSKNDCQTRGSTFSISQLKADINGQTARCEVCKISFANLSLFVIHKANAAKDSKCQGNRLDLALWRLELENDVAKFCCPLCQLIRPNEEVMLSHLRSCLDRVLLEEKEEKEDKKMIDGNLSGNHSHEDSESHSDPSSDGENSDSHEEEISDDDSKELNPNIISLFDNSDDDDDDADGSDSDVDPGECEVTAEAPSSTIVSIDVSSSYLTDTAAAAANNSSSSRINLTIKGTKRVSVVGLAKDLEKEVNWQDALESPPVQLDPTKKQKLSSHEQNSSQMYFVDQEQDLGAAAAVAEETYDDPLEDDPLEDGNNTGAKEEIFVIEGLEEEAECDFACCLCAFTCQTADILEQHLEQDH